MQKFTPGPWTLCRTTDGGKTVAFHVAADPHGSLHPVVEYREGKVRAPEEIEANARLISAAPELYEALKELAAAYDNYDGGSISEKRISRAIEAADAALTKARGDVNRGDEA